MTNSSWEKQLRQQYPDLPAQAGLASLVNERDFLISVRDSIVGFDRRWEELLEVWCDLLDPLAKKIAESQPARNLQRRNEAYLIGRSVIGRQLVGVPLDVMPGTLPPPTSNLANKKSIVGHLYGRLRSEIRDSFATKLLGPKARAQRKRKKGDEEKEKEKIAVEFASSLLHESGTGGDKFRSCDEALSNSLDRRGHRFHKRLIDDPTEPIIAEEEKDFLDEMLEKVADNPLHWCVVLYFARKREVTTHILDSAEHDLGVPRAKILEILGKIEAEAWKLRPWLKTTAKRVWKNPAWFPAKKNSQNYENLDRGCKDVPNSSVDALERAFPALITAV